MPDGRSQLYVNDSVPYLTLQIRPGSDPNCFNNDGHGVIPVAILGSDTFDVTEVDPGTVVLDGAAARVKGKSGKTGSLEDVNDDGFDDLVLQIEDIGGTYATGDTFAILTGQLKEEFGGIPLEGTDTICIVP